MRIFNKCLIFGVLLLLLTLTCPLTMSGHVEYTSEDMTHHSIIDNTEIPNCEEINLWFEWLDSAETVEIMFWYPDPGDFWEDLSYYQYYNERLNCQPIDSASSSSETQQNPSSTEDTCLCGK